MQIDDCFEALAWLGALDQLSEKEFERLAAHLKTCYECRSSFDRLDGALEAQDATRHPADWRNRATRLAFGPERYMQRFVMRATEEGVCFSSQVQRRARWNWIATGLWRPALALVCMLVMLIGGGVATRKELRQEAVAKAVKIEPQAKVAEVQAELQSAISAQKESEAKLHAAEKSVRMEARRANDLQERVHALAKELEILQASERSSQASVIAAQLRIQDLKQQVAKSEDELKQLQTGQQHDAATITEQQYRIGDLLDQLKKSDSALKRTEEFLSANRDIRDLMGARSLHLIDVLDVDGSKTGKTFVRVFYTEGKSLIFYVFDEDDPVKDARYSFQAWGYREPAASAARNLGVFYKDDEKQRRWVLKFDDPEVLAHIDAVFVTLEAPGGAKRPSSKKLLYAYLKGQPNHP